MLTCRTATVQRVVASETPNGEYKKVPVLKLYLKNVGRGFCVVRSSAVETSVFFAFEFYENFSDNRYRYCTNYRVNKIKK